MHAAVRVMSRLPGPFARSTPRSPPSEWSQQYRWPVVITLAYGVGLVAVDRYVQPGILRPIFGGPPENVWFVRNLARCVFAGVIFILLWHIVAARSIRAGLARALAGPLSVARIAHTSFVVFLLVPVFYHFFRCWKAAIAYLHPFRHDVLFARVDAWLHGGDPWRPLHALVDTPRFIRQLDAFYTMGYMVTLAGVIVWIAWRRPDALRARFLLVLVLMWVVLGTVVALLASSGGPVFYERIVGVPRFAPLLAKLDAAGPLWALRVTDELWMNYLRRADSAISGISAFPSLHVAMPALYTCFAYSAGRRWVAAVFAGVTLVTLFGSVYLAWHYAIDGYAAIAGTVGLWWLSGRIMASGAAAHD